MKSLLISAALALHFAGRRCRAHPRTEALIAVAFWHAIAQAPAKARTWKNPYDNQPGAIDAGAKLYRQHCAECHGDDARGIGHAADLHSTGVQNATPGELAWFLRNGNLAYGMPSWSGIARNNAVGRLFPT